MPLFFREKKNLIIFITLVIFHLLLISVQVPRSHEKSFFEKAVFYIFSPFQHGILSFFRTVGHIWRNYFYLRDVQNQNNRMKEEIFYLRQESNLLRNALEKFKSEMEIEENLLRMHENILPAQVIGLDTSNFYKSAIINKGTLNGLKENMIVLDKNGNLVGRIIDVISLKEARVQLVTDDKSGIGVFLQKKKIPGILVGDGEGLCFLKYVLSTTRMEDIPEGDEVFTSGYDRIYPSGIKVGKIISVTPTELSLHMNIIVKPYFDFRYLDQVAVIMKDPKEFFQD